jgi:hypothetical protein
MLKQWACGCLRQPYLIKTLLWAIALLVTGCVVPFF